MDRNSAVMVFESLASSTRLDIFRLLVRLEPAGCVVGQIASELSLPSTNLSFHLKALSHSGLLTAVNEGRYVRYRANIQLMAEIVHFLTDECCNGASASTAEQVQ